jgi:hypothetical protein
MNDKWGVVVDRLRSARINRPYTLALATLLPVPGVLAIVYGDAVSAALSNIAAGAISRVMGVALLVGASLTLVGLCRSRHLIEAAGLTVMAGGCAIYGLGVLLGLGLGGAVAGTVSIAVAAGTVLRVVSLLSAAHSIGNGGAVK